MYLLNIVLFFQIIKILNNLILISQFFALIMNFYKNIFINYFLIIILIIKKMKITFHN